MEKNTVVGGQSLTITRVVKQCHQSKSFKVTKLAGTIICHVVEPEKTLELPGENTNQLSSTEYENLTVKGKRQHCQWPIKDKKHSHLMTSTETELSPEGSKYSIIEVISVILQGRAV